MLVYALIDPRTNELRYIGKSKADSLRRAKSHTSKKSLKLRDHCHSWLRSLVSAGFRPDVEVLERGIASMEDLSEAERFWIAYFRFIGSRLTNMTDGGEGGSGSKSLETRRLIGEKNRIALRGNVPWNKGKTDCFSPETIERWKKARRGRKQSQETRNKRANKLRGRKNPTAGPKISAALKSNTWNVRPVVCVDDGNSFPTVRAAAEFYGANRHCVSAVCRGKLKTASGRKFKFL